ncbi:MAG: hypothetical protein DME06_19340 [Candidatus Rokuibacteriota bacterium]|nr:MAG: hypothetical protein DME06_19340 [Candidatus Rokubacteria bacterium]
MVHSLGLRTGMGLPNWLTVLRILLIPVFVSLLVYRRPGTALAVFCLASLTDLLDGYVARRGGSQSRLAPILDHRGRDLARRDPGPRRRADPHDGRRDRSRADAGGEAVDVLPDPDGAGRDAHAVPPGAARAPGDHLDHRGLHGLLGAAVHHARHGVPERPPGRRA